MFCEKQLSTNHTHWASRTSIPVVPEIQNVSGRPVPEIQNDSGMFPGRHVPEIQNVFVGSGTGPIARQPV